MSTQSTESAKNVFDLMVSRRIHASLEEVFAAWTEPRLFEQWFDTTQISMNEANGGLYFFECRYNGRTWAHYGRDLRVERPRLLERTWMSEGTKGKESIVKVELTPADGGTEVRITHTGLPDEDSAKGHEAGWTDILAAMAEKIGRR